MVSDSEMIEQRLEASAGVVPVLSLENTVLLPHSLQLLRITAPLDCQLVSDVLASGSLLAIDLQQVCSRTGSILSPGTEIRPVCLASIVSPAHLESGHYSLLVQGHCRARSVTLLNTDTPYRTALLDLKPDYYPEEPVIHREHRQLELIEHYSRIFTDHVSEPTYFHQLHRDIELGMLCDTLAGSLPLESPLQQLILAEQDVDQRSDLLLSFLKSIVRQQQRDPAAAIPSNGFSLN
jgi:Lon protease-like protein